MKIELIERPLDEFRHSYGKKKVRVWRKNKRAIIAQGLRDEKRGRDLDEYLNKER